MWPTRFGYRRITHTIGLYLQAFGHHPLNTGIVFDIRRFSVHDGPGIRTAVFLKGCPLHCAWCHNPEGLSPQPEILRRSDRCIACGRCKEACSLGLDPRRQAGTLLCADCATFGSCAEACPAEALQVVGRRMTVGEVMLAVRADLPFYEESGGGVTFTGGEPLAQSDFVLELMRACRSEGIHVAIDTCGWASRSLLIEAGTLADLVLFDLKLVDTERHRIATGVPSDPIIENLAALAAAGSKIALRIPLIPGVNDSSEDLEAAARIAGKYSWERKTFPNSARSSRVREVAESSQEVLRIQSVHILPYHDAAKGKYKLRNTPYPLGETPAPTADAIQRAALVFQRAGFDVTIGG